MIKAHDGERPDRSSKARRTVEDTRGTILMSLTFSCVAGNQTQFTLSSHSVENEEVCVVTFVCPKCGEHTGVTKREGGGIIIASDKHAADHSRRGRAAHLNFMTAAPEFRRATKS
jgi:predicted RNA-binding Zn-ribbon protein involved in translation (DUF1610 family)